MENTKLDSPVVVRDWGREWWLTRGLFRVIEPLCTALDGGYVTQTIFISPQSTLHLSLLHSSVLASFSGRVCLRCEKRASSSRLRNHGRATVKLLFDSSLSNNSRSSSHLPSICHMFRLCSRGDMFWLCMGHMSTSGRQEPHPTI